MNRQTTILLALALALIGGTAAGLGWLRTHQRLGAPGLKASLIPDSARLDIPLPEHVLDYESRPVQMDTNLYIFLPHDTSFAQRHYFRGSSNDENGVLLNVVMMGADRTSIHKPQFCLVGQGWKIENEKSGETNISMRLPRPYDLPVMKLRTTRPVVMADGHEATRNGIYVYWFVADQQLTASHGDRMWRMAEELLRTGVLQRWAYVTCFTECWPGQEDAAYQRIVDFIQASVPQFQLVPGPAGGPQTAASQTIYAPSN